MLADCVKRWTLSLSGGGGFRRGVSTLFSCVRERWMICALCSHRKWVQQWARSQSGTNLHLKVSNVSQIRTEFTVILQPLRSFVALVPVFGGGSSWKAVVGQFFSQMIPPETKKAQVLQGAPETLCRWRVFHLKRHQRVFCVLVLSMSVTPL